MRQGKQQQLIFLFAWLFVVPTCVEGLTSNSWKENLFGGKLPQEQLTSKQEGALLLQELNLTSNTEPKRFSVEPKALPDILAASIPALFRLGTGAFAEGYSLEIVDRNPSEYTILPLGDKKQLAEFSNVESSSRATNMAPIVLYDREGNAACRLVREACSTLSLQVTIKPCPVNGLIFGKQLQRQDMKKSLPILKDPNTGIELTNESRDVEPILSYLFKAYGNGEPPWTLSNTNFAYLTAAVGLVSRFGKGSYYQTSDPPALPLTMWGYESSPFCKLVTEQLGSFELEYTLIYTPRGSPNRQKMLDEYGRFQVPFLQDPNTGVELWESFAICEYLEKQYGARTPIAYL